MAARPRWASAASTLRRAIPAAIAIHPSKREGLRARRRRSSRGAVAASRVTGNGWRASWRAPRSRAFAPRLVSVARRASRSRWRRRRSKSEGRPRRRAHQEDRAAEDEPEPWVDDEEDVAVVPAVRERREEPHAVGVEQIEQRVGERAEVSEGEEAGQRDRLAAGASPPRGERQDRDQDEREQEESERPVGRAAANAQRGVLTAEVGEHVDVGQVRGGDQHGGHEGHAASEPGAGDAAPTRVCARGSTGRGWSAEIGVRLRRTANRRAGVRRAGCRGICPL